jgi:hypothetical protein
MDGVSSRLLPERVAPALSTVAEFELKWCGGGVIAYVAHSPGRPPAVEFRLNPPSLA